MRRVANVGDGHGDAVFAAARAARALNVIAGLGWHVAQEHGLQSANVHAHLEGGRAAQYVDLASNKPFLILLGCPVGELRGVLLHHQWQRRERVTPPIMIAVGPPLLRLGLDQMWLAGTLWRGTEAKLVRGGEPPADLAGSELRAGC